ncbi:MAG: hypothetical protein KBS73_00630 [Bacteroidales bacterium]|nr:hypothetical protein [Candidatus Cacconaster equifaecalis]
MKRYFTQALCAVTLIGLVSCQKEDHFTIKDSTRESLTRMTFGVKGDGLKMAVSTKAEVVSEVNNVYWMATGGTVGTDTLVHEPQSVSLSEAEDSFNTGKYWPSEDIDYNYYVSNVQFSWDSGAATIEASNETDIVAGIAEAAYKSSPEVTVDHIFCRTGALTLEAQEGYELVGTAIWKIQSNESTGTAGAYNIGTKEWSNVSALSREVFTSESDLYLIPGSYNIEITYTLKKGNFQKEYTKAADVELNVGKVNNIKATAHVGDDGAEEIVFSVSVTPWEDEDVVIEQSDLK